MKTFLPPGVQAQPLRPEIVRITLYPPGGQPIKIPGEAFLGTGIDEASGLVKVDVCSERSKDGTPIVIETYFGLHFSVTYRAQTSGIVAASGKLL